MPNVPAELFDGKFLRDELDLPYNCVGTEVIDQTRWSVIKEGVFEYQGRFYQVWWSEGATENQYESPWEYSEPEPVEVELREVTVKKWVPVE